MREIYKYNEQGYYIGSDKQNIDDLETKKANKEVYPSLHMATNIVPPQYNPELELLKYDNWTWSIEDIELQGKYYKKSNTDEFDKILKKDLSLYTEVQPFNKYDDGTTQVFNENKNEWEYSNKGAELLEFEAKEKERIAQEEEERIKEQRLKNIKDEIANTLIEFKWWKWKIRKKDLGYYSAANVYSDKTNITPIHIKDFNYRVIEMYYEDFVSLWRLVEEKRTEIIDKYE